MQTKKFSNAQTWTAGPMHTVQKQHIPGYAGHIHHLIAENQFGQSFAKITNKCVDDKLETDFQQSSEEKYKTVNHINFGKPKVIQQNAQRILVQTQQPIEIEPIDRVPIVGYQGFRPKFRHPIKQVIQPQQITLTEINQKRDVFPVVGYTGYIPKIKSQNMYAHSYEELTKQSILF